MSYLEITFTENGGDETVPNFSLPFADSELFYAEILRAEKLTHGNGVKTVYDVTISRKDINQEFCPGDTIGILPQNDGDIVDRLLDRLNVKHNADKVYIISVLSNAKKKIPSHLPCRCTLRKLFTRNIDLNSAPKKLFLKSLTKYTKNEGEVARITNLCSPEGSGAYVEFISGEGRTLFGLLSAFPSCQPPVELILEHSTSLKPRPYSISSSPLDGNLHITFFVLEIDNQTKGVCTGWLERLIVENGILDKQADIPVLLPLYFRKTHDFCLPKDDSLPVILIATGTGVAPFRGFLRHRAHQIDEQINNNFGAMWLFYGCRYVSRDFLYKSEITEFLRSKVLHRLHMAFSRQFRDKVYVQHKLEEYGAELATLILKDKAVIYICGDPKQVVISVKETLKKILVRFGHLSVEQAAKELEDGQRCIADVWC